MPQTTETNERRPWTVQSVLGQLEQVGVFDVSEIQRALRSEGETLSTTLRDVFPKQSPRARINAAALLLMFNDRTGRAPFMEALAGPDGDERTLAIEFLQYYLRPHDIALHGELAIACPLSSDEVFTALKRDLHEPWNGVSLRVLEIVSRQGYPQAQCITRSMLMHSDNSLRRMIAESYLRAGRDEGAFDVVEAMLRAAPAYVPHRDPRWHDFYQVKVLWHSLEMAAERGNTELGNKVASLVMELVTRALDAPDLRERFDINDGLMELGSATKILASVLPGGAQRMLERLIACDAISGFHRGEALTAYAQAFADEARPIVASALQDHALREHAARAFGPLVKAKNDPRDIAALSDALTNEARPGVVAAIAKALLAAGPRGKPIVEATLDRSEPWARVELAWNISGGTDREFANLLTEAGVMDPVTDEQLEEALNRGFDVQGLIYAGGQRLIGFNVKSSSDLEHFELFQNLIKATRPVVAIDDLAETCHANLLREPVAGMPGVEKITDLGTICTVSFKYQGRAFKFDTRPQGRWHDVAAVMKGFDAFMQAIGRDDRCYELEGGEEWAFFVVAPATKFEPIAARLGIPLERDVEGARDAAKAYQRQIQASH